MLTADGKAEQSPELVAFCAAVKVSIPVGENRAETAAKWVEKYCTGDHQGKTISPVVASFVINGNLDPKNGNVIGPKWLGALLAKDLHVAVPEEFEYKGPATGPRRKYAPRTPPQPTPLVVSVEPAAVEEPPREFVAATEPAAEPVVIKEKDFETQFTALTTLIKLGLSLEELNDAAANMISGKGLSTIPSVVQGETRRAILQERLLLIALTKQRSAERELPKSRSAVQDSALLKVMENLYHYLQQVCAKVAEDIEPLVATSKTIDIPVYIVEAFERDYRAHANLGWWADILVRYGHASGVTRHNIAQKEIFPKLQAMFPDKFEAK